MIREKPMLRFIAALFLFFAPAAPALAQHSDEEGIRAAVFDYFNGQTVGSAEQLNRAFVADNATMVGLMRAQDGTESLRTWRDMNEVITNWSANPNPAAPARDGEILDMHIVDGRIATVIFRSTTNFYDALTLFKIDGQWRIVAKAFIRQ
jgi:hypothetical protein